MAKKDDYLGFKINADDKKRIMEAAKLKDVTLSVYCADILIKNAVKDLKK